MLGGKHLILVSWLVVRKPIDMRLGSPNGVGGAERAIASGEFTFIFHLCWVGISGKERSKDKNQLV